MLRPRLAVFVLSLTSVVFVSRLESAELVGSASLPSTLQSAAPPLVWYDDYELATTVARTQGRMLLCYFRDPAGSQTAEQFETRALASSDVQRRLADYVLLKLPLDAEITVGGEPLRLVDHPSFGELHQRDGIAIIDWANRDSEQYRHVVSELPLSPGRYYKFHPNHLAVMLDLPAGSLTQRTMIFAVRIHPEAPASTVGQLDGQLAIEAESHSQHQAQIRVQGHHNWGQRFQRIGSRLPGGLHAQEVVAESWPGEGMVEAAVDCVASWRQSSGHWSAVRSRQPRFGYDMRRGSNGIWYATGIFGNRS